ncbi:uncharacterized protein T551_02717 [Pneumocystis jirovecii RU7]|uniref:Uncharacterized protein n=1 Tax=Pneumocystis jirovecii (strain RU7) TaxID=1408657 RepID=A0A0W4ZIV1_PNEJ7|nr:uncharacterized protein T551_02717 [Pneumocystis jirovecii RU7]KTW28298.1 hypothetical protein T551_02717 [Pneumocystis jirovecii RU7]
MKQIQKKQIHKEGSRNLFQKSIKYDKNTFVFSVNNPAFSFLELPEGIFHIKKLSEIAKLQKQSILFHETYSKKELKMHIFLNPSSCFTSNPTYNIFQFIHFDLDLKEYSFNENENWAISSFIGICVLNLKNVVDEILELFNISKEEEDTLFILKKRQNMSSQLTMSIFMKNNQIPLTKDPYSLDLRIFISINVNIASFRAFVQNRL